MEGHTILFILLGGIIFLWVWTHFIETNWFHLKKVTIRLKKPLARPIQILHLSDLHCVKKRIFLEQFFDRLAKLKTDFVFVTGDLIDHPGGIQHCVRQLKKLKPDRGIYAVLGNHDYRNYFPFICTWERPETHELKQALIETGVRILHNENISVELSQTEEAVIIGIDDPVTGRDDIEKAFQGIKNGTIHLALIHSPSRFPTLHFQDIDVAFSGHTHGGQIRIPGKGPLPWVYHIEPIIDSTDRFGFVGIVSKGLAAQPLLSLRFFCRPEALLVRIEGS